MATFRHSAVGICLAGLLLLGSLAAFTGCGGESADKPDVAAVEDATVDSVESDVVDATIDVDPPAAFVQFLPGQVDYGSVELASKYVRSIRLCNLGTASLVVSQVQVLEPQPGVTVEVDGSYPLTVPVSAIPGGCDTGKVLQVTFQATLPLTKSKPAAVLAFALNTTDLPVAKLPVLAAPNGPKLRVTPLDQIDFALVGPGVTVQRTVELFNEGNAEMVVSAIGIEGDQYDEFDIVPGSFGPAASPPKPGLLGPGKYASFQVRLTAKGPANQQAKAKLTISSSDIALPQWPLSLVGQRTSTATCAVQFVQPTVDFGVLAYGAQKQLAVGLQNTGSGNCKFANAKLTDCPATGFGGISVPPVCNASGSNTFGVLGATPNLFSLQPGDIGTLQVGFIAPEDSDSFGQLNAITSFYGLLVTEFVDLASGATLLVPNVQIWDPNQVEAAKPNLLAKVGKAEIAVQPSKLEFTATTVGCKTPSKQIIVASSGTADVFVNHLELAGCNGEFEIESPSPIADEGLAIGPGAELKISVRYAPSNPDLDQCQAKIWTSVSGQCTSSNGTQTGTPCVVNTDCGDGAFCAGQLLTVPLHGEGIVADSYTEVVTKLPAKQVDLLFVIDDTASMANEQAKLANSLEALLLALQAAKLDFHIGVVTTDMDDPAKQGKLQQSGGYRVVTNQTPDALALLQTLVQQGINGAGVERGLEAAETAITEPLTTDLGKPCYADSDCATPAKCVADADDPAVKRCGGANRTFLRKSAALAIVIVSDQDDSSAINISYYNDFFYSVKGLGNKNQFHLHALVGPKPNGCQSSTGTGLSGSRYIDVAEKTGGLVGVICDASYTSFLQEIVATSSGGATELPLTYLPDPDLLVVEVSGLACSAGPKGWNYDTWHNSVYFPSSSACMPAEGDKVEVSYPLLCLP